MSASTKKVDAKNLKAGDRFKVPSAFCTVTEVKKFDGATLDTNILVFTISGDEGPFRGTKTVIIVHSGDKVDKLLRHPWPRRLFEAILGKICDAAWRKPK